jgi:lipoprotein-anchoring transpeptidase ErfK/SrfK
MRSLAISVFAVLAVAAGCDESKKETPEVTAPKTPPRVVEQARDFAARVPNGTTVALRERPGGRVLATVGARTEFGSPQILAVVRAKGDWVGVLSPALENSQVGWARVEQLRLIDSPLTLDVDLSARRLTVRDLSGVVRRVSVAIGAPDTATPPGDFYVTDKLNGADFGSYYGCCILALSGRQPNLPQGWSGGDRLAIHGSPTPTWGKAVSNGCLHADEADLRYLMRWVPLGTYVRVQA